MSIDERLRALGVSQEEIDQARAEGTLSLLATSHAAVPGPPHYTAPEIAERAGISPELAKRFWRALGFPDVADDVRFFTDADAEALGTVSALLSSQFAQLEVAVQLSRVLGSSLARVAEAQVAAGAANQRPADLDELFAEVAGDALDIQARLIEYVWRRHLQAASVRARMSRGTGSRATVEAAIGFADLVGFTALSQQLGETDLAEVVGRFETIAYDLVTAHGGRVAKMIGDEAMFVVGNAADGVAIGLALAEAYADDEVLSDVRVGLAVGPVLALEGDYFGPVVNLASRIVNIALPGSVVVSEEVHSRLEHDDRFVFRSIRPRFLKNIGRVRLWTVRRPGDADDDPARERRRERRARLARVGREAMGSLVQQKGGDLPRAELD